jgi:hypothetical protein
LHCAALAVQEAALADVSLVISETRLTKQLRQAVLFHAYVIRIVHVIHADDLSPLSRSMEITREAMKPAEPVTR